MRLGAMSSISRRHVASYYSTPSARAAHRPDVPLVLCEWMGAWTPSPGAHRTMCRICLDAGRVTPANTDHPAASNSLRRVPLRNLYGAAQYAGRKQCPAHPSARMARQHPRLERRLFGLAIFYYFTVQTSDDGLAGADQSLSLKTNLGPHRLSFWLDGI